MHRTLRFSASCAAIAAAILAAPVLGPAVTPVATAQESAALPIDTALFRNIARQQNPIVVGITSRTRVDVTVTQEEEALRRFFGLPPQSDRRVEQDVGSGFLISREGEILTNDHVVAGANVIEVTLLGEEATTYSARVVGRDPLSDTAIIRLERPPANLPVARLGDSDALAPGDWVMAIGNPFRLGHSVTVGVVSYQGRPFEMQEGRWQKMIQTDASINPGNSGGPLINLRGEVVGMNTAMLADGDSGGVGIGFAIPINSIKTLLPQLRAGGVVRGDIGVQLQSGPITSDDAAALGLPGTSGGLVTFVERDSPASRGGIRAGDVIIRFGRTPTSSADELEACIASTPPGSRVTVTIVRDGREHTKQVIVEELPVDAEATAVPRDGGREPELGLTFVDVTSSNVAQLGFAVPADGAVVFEIETDSTADRAGIEQGDVLRRVNQRVVRTAAEAAQAFHQISAGRSAFLLLWREGDEVLIRVQKQTTTDDQPDIP